MDQLAHNVAVAKSHAIAWWCRARWQLSSAYATVADVVSGMSGMSGMSGTDSIVPSWALVLTNLTTYLRWSNQPRLEFPHEPTQSYLVVNGSIITLDPNAHYEFYKGQLIEIGDV